MSASTEKPPFTRTKGDLDKAIAVIEKLEEIASYRIAQGITINEHGQEVKAQAKQAAERKAA